MNERLWSTRRTPRLEVAQPAEEVDEPPEVLALERDGQRVDGEVAPVEVLPDRRLLDRRQRPGVVVELGARGGDVDPPAVVDDDCRAELVVRDDAAAQRLRQCPAERDAVALDGDVDVEARLVHEQVANRPADEVDALEALPHRLDGLEDALQPGKREQALAQVGPRRAPRLARSARRGRGGGRSGRRRPRPRPRAETATRPASEVRSRRVELGRGVSSAQVTTSVLMTLFTGACERPCAIAWSRFSRVTWPARRSASPTRIPLWRWRWHSTIAWATGVVGPDEARRARHDLGRRRTGRAARGSAARTSSRASASEPRCTAEAACGWPPPSRAAIAARRARRRACARRRRRGRPSPRGRRAPARP